MPKVGRTSRPHQTSPYQRPTNNNNNNNKMTPQQKLQAELEAKDARRPGFSDPNPVGGLHGDVKKHSDRYRFESNHTPPQDVYANTPFSHIKADDLPAMRMHYYHHRNPAGKEGGATSTGGNAARVKFNEEAHQHLRNGDWHKAFMKDANDIRNTTAPNRDFYVPSLTQSAYAARQSGLIRNDQELLEVLTSLNRQ